MVEGRGSEERIARAMEDFVLVADSIQQATALLANEEDGSEEAPGQFASFLNVVALGSVGAGKSAALNSLMGCPVLPTGENGATRAPIIIQMHRDSSSSNRGLSVVLDGKTTNVSASDVRHSLQGRLKSWAPNARSGGTEGILLTLQSGAAPPLKLFDLPGLDSRPTSDEKLVQEFAQHNDAMLLVVIPATSIRDVAISKVLKLAHELDPDAGRTVGVISKVDQAASDPRSLDAIAAVLSGNGPSMTQEISWVAMIGQSVSIAAAHGSEDSLETAWKAEAESLKSLLTRTKPTKLGRVALVETIAKQMLERLKQRLPSLSSGLQGKSQEVLETLGELRVETPEGTRAIALKLCREFEDVFLQHINTGEGEGWKVVASFEGVLPKRVKQIPLDNLFELSNVQRLILEADGYQPYLVSPEKGLKALIRKALEMAKDPAKACVDEVHRILVGIVSAAASATPGLRRYPPLKREMVAIASSALDDYRSESRKMVIALVDMERVFIPPQHFIRLVQRRMDRLRREDELQGRNAEQTLLSRANVTASQGGTLKVIGDNLAGWLSRKHDKTNESTRRWFVLNVKTNKFACTKSPDDRSFRSVINLEECLLEDGADEVDQAGSDSSGDKKSGDGHELEFKLSHRVPHKTVFKAHHVVMLKAENMAEKLEWMTRLRSCIAAAQGSTIKVGIEFDSSQRFSNNYDTSGELDIVLRRPADPDEDLKTIAQEVRDYVEAVLNSLSANIPKAIVLSQIERAKDAMLNQLYSSISARPTEQIQELLQEDREVKRRREKVQRQVSMLHRLTRQLSLNEVRASSATAESGDSGPSTSSAPDDWRVAFEEAGSDSFASSQRSSNGRGPSPRRQESPMRVALPRYNNGYVDNDEAGASRPAPGRLPPPPPPQQSRGPL